MNETTPDPDVHAFDDLLNEIPPRQRKAALDDLPDLVAAIKYFLDRKAEKDPRAHVTFTWFYTNKLRDRFGGPSVQTVRDYVRNVLRRDIRTGKPL